MASNDPWAEIERVQRENETTDDEVLDSFEPPPVEVHITLGPVVETIKRNYLTGETTILKFR